MRGEFGIDARAAEEKQLIHARFVGAVDEVVLNLQVLVEERGRLLIIGKDAADFGRRDEDVFGLGFAIEFVHGSLVEEIEFLAKTPYDAGKALFMQFAPDSAANQTAMAGYVDSGFALHRIRG